MFYETLLDMKGTNIFYCFLWSSMVILPLFNNFISTFQPHFVPTFTVTVTKPSVSSVN